MDYQESLQDVPQKPRREKTPRFRVEKRRLVIIAAVILIGYLMLDLNARLSELSLLSGERNRLFTQVAQNTATLSYLATEVAYSQSNDAVDAYARVDNRLAQPGDYVVIPIPAAGEVDAVVLQPTPTGRPVENWEVWVELFFK